MFIKFGGKENSGEASGEMRPKEKRVLLLLILSIFIFGIISGMVLLVFAGRGILIPGEPSWQSKNIIGADPETAKEKIASIKEQDLDEVLAYLKLKEIKKGLIPSGVPDIYGSELNINFDKAQEAISGVAPLDLTYGSNKIYLTADELKRYIDIGSQTACKYCCGAVTLVNPDGSAACGCEHSQMMRGLAAYLIKNHPELSNEQILKELNSWRAVFFPKQTLTDKLAEMEQSGDQDIKQIVAEFPEFLPQMVGGC